MLNGLLEFTSVCLFDAKRNNTICYFFTSFYFTLLAFSTSLVIIGLAQNNIPEFLHQISSSKKQHGTVLLRVLSNIVFGKKLFFLLLLLTFSYINIADMISTAGANGPNTL